MIDITMPRLSDTMTEGVISSWHKAVGDPVAAGDVLVEIETDKAVMEHEAYEPGTLAEIVVAAGGTAPIGATIARIDEGPTDSPAPLAATVPPAPTEPDPIGSTTLDRPAAPTSRAERRPATPLVRRMARERGLDLSLITGSGPGGRIVRADLDRETTVPPEPTSPADPGRGTGSGDDRDSTLVPFDQVRQAIATRLVRSATTIPQFTVTTVTDVEELLQLRGRVNAALAGDPRDAVTVNDLVVRGCALALRAHPEVNVSYADDGRGATLQHGRIHIGIAIAAPSGLVVPVLRDADLASATTIAARSRRFAVLAAERGLAPADLADGTFTVSNLGMFGVEQFSAIINPPQGAILAVGSARAEPAAIDGEVVVRRRLRCTLTADHRVIDGALAARFLTTLTGLLEEPLRLLA
ncbi:dihydrolipoamide acetyltransferase family protein [Microlunatus speluncae]|uniref:dihydrolipoamide acetyltransferase family protein n=1 Tax=Microlunatus speluncae TaxID=2594267 RepID=UPI0012663BD7|nr:dihydrolipoamide acetyltransferase family protein [Microlunatus speluncae]